MDIRKVPTKEMIDEIKKSNTEYIYDKLEKSGKTEAIKDIYKAYMNGDERMFRSDNIYLLYKDISGSDPEKFSHEVKRFIEDKSLLVATVYMLEDYIDSLDRAYKSDRNSYEMKAISQLKARLSYYKREAEDSMKRSIVMSLNDTERETLYKYAEKRLASE
ncbi:MAG: hypothetical protein QW814_00945 [Methanothrix sp.]